MKLIKYCTYVIGLLFVISCQKILPLPQSEIYGVYEPAIYQSILNPSVEIKSDQTLIWKNYQGLCSSKKFTYTYDADKNRLSLFQEGKKKSVEQLNFTKDKKSNIQFASSDVVMNLDGEFVSTITVYKKK